MSFAQLALQSVEFAHPGMTAPLFTDLTVQFPSGWTGIVGPNGAGKTTLLKVVTGELAVQSGSVHRQGLALYVAQRTDEPPEMFEDFIWAPDATVLKARLRVSEDWPDRWSTLSHGERKRAQIAVALWREPAVLALDEPSNHIDADARRLLLLALTEFTGIGLLVSHDRALLDELCTQCLIIDPPDAVMRPGGVTEAMEQQDSEEKSARHADDIMRRTENRLRDEAQRRRVVAEQKSAASRGSKQIKIPINDHDGRAQRNLAKMSGKDAYAGKMVAQMNQRAGKVATQRSETTLKKRYETGIWVDGASYMPRDFLLRLPAGSLPLGGGRHLNFPDLEIGGTSRIAITGANGLGKSTLINHLLAHLQLPEEKLVSVPQEISAEDSRVLLEAVKRLPNDERGRVMTTISRLGSRPARLLESALPSPGEVRKLLLAIGIVRGPHLIVMDEPTNHMDLPGIMCLEGALVDCPCAMLLVSHDEEFLKKITAIEWHLSRDGTGDTRLEIVA
ncbi:ATP-binding cassette domain-containing protein [Rariglobus hedericola]|uniref:ABC-F family ATP-binding cassette domain-containing protein n=1 Tax=Rariglobus hedericola TaxID=2597822 RepID=A0A556QN42_9BACT|nr:ATP-binding cassette domain-containing protein [Rariglobus hedericola]TSJ78053.1 ABC-F family ATP-binding cassette domain-containing protein [Rariglobus hedericola]